MSVKPNSEISSFLSRVKTVACNVRGRKEKRQPYSKLSRLIYLPSVLTPHDWHSLLHSSPPVSVSPLSSLSMASSSAIRFVTGTKKSPLGSLHLQLHVKPGASKNREGVIAITDDAIELCVAAQAREGEANKAVVQVLSSVLGVPKSSLQLTHGLKSRDKTVVLNGFKGDGEDYARTVRELLDKALEE
ncbi:hypothetical protein NW767_001381 [Fusarium falciforme]|nr:hypothetical protein NW767_001381 [Fusarium falciforme]